MMPEALGYPDEAGLLLAGCVAAASSYAGDWAEPEDRMRQGCRMRACRDVFTACPSGAARSPACWHLAFWLWLVETCTDSAG